MKKFYTVICLLLLIPVLGFGSWATMSGGIPEIGIQNFIGGQYPIVFHDNMAREFPGREILMDWSRQINDFYTFSGFSSAEDVQILVPIVNDGADHGATMPEWDVPTSMPPETYENESTAESTEESSEAPSETPAGTPDEQETVVDEEEVSVEAFGQILLLGDRAMELPVADYDAILKYSQAVSAISDSLQDVNVYSLLVPNSAGLYAPKEYQENEDSQKMMIDYAYNKMDPSVHKIDAFSMLEEHRNEYLYFRTDHHWTHLGAYYAYNAFCHEAGFTSASIEQFATGQYEAFLGTMYSFLGGYSQREILRENPDTLTYYIPDRETTVRYYDSGSLYYGGKMDLFYPLPESYSNKYICFLGGDHPITIIETDQPEERVCLLIKESYGNAFASWLTSHYSKIICIDPREFNRNDKPSLDLKEFAERMGVDDCIILNYPLMINSSAYGAWLGRLVQ